MLYFMLRWAVREKEISNGLLPAFSHSYPTITAWAIGSTCQHEDQTWPDTLHGTAYVLMVAYMQTISNAHELLKNKKPGVKRGRLILTEWDLGRLLWEGIFELNFRIWVGFEWGLLNLKSMDLQVKSVSLNGKQITSLFSPISSWHSVFPSGTKVDYMHTSISRTSDFCHQYKSQIFSCHATTLKIIEILFMLITPLKQQ